MNKENVKVMAGPMRGIGTSNAGKAKNFKKSIGNLIKCFRPFRLLFWICIFFIVIASLLTIIGPSFLKIITDELSHISPMSTGVVDLHKITVYSIILAIIYGCCFITQYLPSFIMSGINQKVAKNLREKISRKINVIPLNYYDTNNIGDVLSRVTVDVDTISQSINQSLTTFINAIILLIGVIIAMFISSWQLTLVAICTVPLSFILLTIFTKISQKYFINMQQQLGEINAHSEECYSGQSVVKVFNAEEKVEKKFKKINNSLCNNIKNSQFFSSMMGPVMSFVGNLGVVSVYVVGALLIVNNTVTFGTMIAFLIYIRLFQNPLGQIAQALASLQSAAAASERVFEFLDEKEQADESNKTIKIDNVKGEVEFKHVKFGYDKSKLIIKDFSASVKPGQKVAIVGPTGAGKTTLINLLMRFYEIDSGDILIDGVSIKDMKREDVRKLFGMVLQDSWLFEGTIRENLIYAKEGINEEEFDNSVKAANVDHFVRTFEKGYETVLDDTANISSGQRQLLTIARAMVQNAPMLILDEATSNVDTRTEHLIQDAMDKMSEGKTSFVIAHRLSTIKNADLILVLKEGDIIEKGTHDELIELGGFYATLYNSQFDLDAPTIEMD